MKKRRHMPMTGRKEKKERVTEIECKTTTYNKPRGDEPRCERRDITNMHRQKIRQGDTRTK
jgi:hypothetical protein